MVLDGLFDELGMRSTYHEHLLYTSKRQTLKCPVQEGGIADGQQTL